MPVAPGPGGHFIDRAPYPYQREGGCGRRGPWPAAEARPARACTPHPKPGRYDVPAHAQPRQLLRVLEEGEGAQRDHVRGRLVAGDEQDLGQLDQLVTVHGPRFELPGGQFVQQPLAPFGPLALDERPEVVVQGFPRGVHLGDPGAAQQLERLGLEELVIAVRDAEQRTDHHRGDGQREGAHQIRGSALRDHRVQQPVDGLLDPGAQGGGPFEREARDQHPALGVVLGVVHAEELDASSAAPGQPCGEHRESGVLAVGREPWVDEECPGLGMSGHQPDPAAVEEGGGRQR